MSFTDILLIGLGLSMDAFAVSMCQGVSMKKLDLRRAALIAVFFGGFQAFRLRSNDRSVDRRYASFDPRH